MSEYYNLQLIILNVDHKNKPDRGSISFDISQMNDSLYQHLTKNDIFELKLRLVESGFNKNIVVEDVKPGNIFHLSFGNEECVEVIKNDFLSRKLENQFREALINSFEKVICIQVDFAIRLEINDIHKYYKSFKESNTFIFSQNLKYQKILSLILKCQNKLNSSLSVLTNDMVEYDENVTSLTNMLEALKIGGLLEKVIEQLKEGIEKNRKFKKYINIILNSIGKIKLIYRDSGYFISALSQINQNYEDSTQIKEKKIIFDIYGYMSSLLNNKSPLKGLDCTDWTVKSVINSKESRTGVVAFVPRMIELFKEMDELTDQYVNPWRSRLNKINKL